MRYKIVMSLITLTALAAAYLLSQDSGPPRPAVPQTANDAILRSLKVQ